MDNPCCNSEKTFLIDFSGKFEDCYQPDSFDDEIIDEIREKASSGTEVFVLIDTGFSSNMSEPFLVKDHLNLTGNNPLVGANNEIGPRFPVINDVYQWQALDVSSLSPLDKLSKKVGAGLKPGVVPSDEEIALINSLGADFYCYNLVPATIVAAHAGKKVCAVIVPPKMKPVDSFQKLLEGES